MKYVLSDIHGNIKLYENIMNQISLGMEDDLYVLGDVIDRYPHGIEILRSIMKMSNVHMLLGNHEWMMLNALGLPYVDRECKHFTINKEQSMMHWYDNDGKVTHDAYKALSIDDQLDIVDYLCELPISIDIEVKGSEYRLVHAAPKDLYALFGNGDSLVEYSIWNRDWMMSPIVPEKFTIYGHTPTAMIVPDQRELEMLLGNNSIGIDCGSGLPDYTEEGDYIGRLGCLRLDDMKEFYSDSTLILPDNRIVNVAI